MLKFKFYDAVEAIQEAWFDSSNIYYSKFIEDKNENKGDLYITFKNGQTYKYDSVGYSDYLVFMNGGLDGSHGKALNQLIKGKYEFEKVEQTLPIQELEDRLYSLKELTERQSSIVDAIGTQLPQILEKHSTGIKLQSNLFHALELFINDIRPLISPWYTIVKNEEGNESIDRNRSF